MADDVLRQAVQGICDLITVPGVINLDFADVKTRHGEHGDGAHGDRHGHGRAPRRRGGPAAISNPLLEEHSIQGARAILINITGGPDMTLHEVNEACQIIQQAADEDANIIFGLVQDARDEGPGEDQRHRHRLRRPRRRAPRGGAGGRAADALPAPPEAIVPDDSGYGVNLINVKARGTTSSTSRRSCGGRWTEGSGLRPGPTRPVSSDGGARIRGWFRRDRGRGRREERSWSSRAAGHMLAKRILFAAALLSSAYLREVGLSVTRPSSGPSGVVAGLWLLGPGNGGWWQPARPANACWLERPVYAMTAAAGSATEALLGASPREAGVRRQVCG